PRNGFCPIAKFRRLTGQESLQVECHWLDRGTAANGDFWIEFSAKPTNRQPGETEARMDSEPKESRQHCSQDEGSSSKRTIRTPVSIAYLGDGDLKLLFNTPPGKESGRSRPCFGTVELRPDGAQ